MILSEVRNMELGNVNCMKPPFPHANDYPQAIVCIPPWLKGLILPPSAVHHTSTTRSLPRLAQPAPWLDA
jgi:hypothetical protein